MMVQLGHSGSMNQQRRNFNVVGTQTAGFISCGGIPPTRLAVYNDQKNMMEQLGDLVIHNTQDNWL